MARTYGNPLHPHKRPRTLASSESVERAAKRGAKRVKARAARVASKRKARFSRVRGGSGRGRGGAGSKSGSSVSGGSVTINVMTSKPPQIVQPLNGNPTSNPGRPAVIPDAAPNVSYPAGAVTDPYRFQPGPGPPTSIRSRGVSWADRLRDEIRESRIRELAPPAGTAIDNLSTPENAGGVPLFRMPLSTDFPRALGGVPTTPGLRTRAVFVTPESTEGRHELPVREKPSVGPAHRPLASRARDAGEVVNRLRESRMRMPYSTASEGRIEDIGDEMAGAPME